LVWPYMYHLLCVDGLVLFCDGSIRDVHNFRDIKDPCCICTWMVLNLGKCNISFVGINEEDKIWLMQVFSFSKVKMQ